MARLPWLTMIPKLIRVFIICSGVLLLLTGQAKILSGWGSSHILQMPDPVFGLSFGSLFQWVGFVEVVVALLCFFGTRPVLQAGAIVLLSSNFVFYRLASMYVGYHKPCSCLGSLTDALHISAEAADTAMKFILGYLLLGSYGALCWLWMKERENGRSCGS